MTRATILSYMEKYAAGTLEPEEEKAFLAWLETASPGEFQQMLDASGVPDDFKAWRQPSTASVQQFRQRLAEREQPVVRRMFPWRRIAAAAAVLIIAGGAAWYMLTRTPEAPITPQQAELRPPGSNKALLTLADGTVIELDDARDGTLSQQGGARIIKLPGGKISYDHADATGEPVYNTISTPKGGQYQVQLSDGTVVWLNAASSLRFPAVFNGGERLVELKGEGYFDVAAQAGSPFRVQVRDARVEVLGTQFNINAYADEPVAQTTLLHGAVKVLRGTETMLLRPGQQASFKEGEKMALQAADLEQAVAWKNGFFHFEGTSLPVLMRQIGRWYNVEVAFKGEVPNRQFAGRITRDVGLQAVVDALKSSGVNYRMQGGVLEVYP